MNKIINLKNNRFKINSNSLYFTSYQNYKFYVNKLVLDN